MFCSVATHHGGYFFISFRIYEYITKHALQSQAFFWGLVLFFVHFCRRIYLDVLNNLISSHSLFFLLVILIVNEILINVRINSIASQNYAQGCF